LPPASSHELAPDPVAALALEIAAEHAGEDDDDDALIIDKEEEALEEAEIAHESAGSASGPLPMPDVPAAPGGPIPPAALAPELRQTPNGVSYYLEGRSYMVMLDGAPQYLGRWLPFGTGDTTVNPAVECRKHGSKCKRSASTNKYANAEGVLMDWLVAGQGLSVEGHKSLPRLPKDKH
jgi:hypothetical protein